MTKAAICTVCMEIFSPWPDWETNRKWRWCHCQHTGVRWRDGQQGLLEVTSLHGKTGVRVLGLNNSFLLQAIADPPEDGLGWRQLHRTTALTTPDHYLFYAGRRSCWALVVRPGESGDITFIEFGTAWAEASPPASSTGAEQRGPNAQVPGSSPGRET